MARFQNVDGSVNPQGLTQLIRWKLGLHDEQRHAASRRQGRSARRPQTPVPIVRNEGERLRSAAQLQLTWIGHASFLAQIDGRNILLDPVYAKRLLVLPRNVPPGVAFGALPKVHVVCVTHNHRDHMDAATLRMLGPDVVYVVPLGVKTWFERAGLRRVVEMRWWEEREIEGVHVTFVPSQHWSRRSLFDENATLWGGFVLERGGARVYHSGDTAWFDGFEEIGRRVGPIHAAMLPIGSYAPRWFMKSQHVDPEESVRAFEALGAERFVAMHWGTFRLTDEALDEPPEFLRRVWQQHGLPDERRFIPAIGETLRFS